MMDTSLGPKPSPLVVEWQMRLEDLRAQLRLQPEHRKVWQWRMEEKVLVYMLARYSQIAALNPLPASPALYIARNAFIGKVKERLSRRRRHQLLEDIEAKNYGKFRPHKEGFMDTFFKDGDAYLQGQINSSRRSKRK